MSAALYVAVTRRFAPDTDVRAITTYVTDVRSRYKDGKSLPPMDLEAMIRAALGEADRSTTCHPKPPSRHNSRCSARCSMMQTTTSLQLEAFIRETERTSAEYM